MRKLILAVGIVAILTAAFLVVQRAMPQSPPVTPGLPLSQRAAEDNPTITWSVPELTQTMFPGVSSTVTISFKASQNLDGITVQVTPSLGGIVSPRPASFASITANQPYQITFTVAVPSAFVKQSFGGTIHLTNSARPSKTYGSPLPVNIQANFAAYFSANSGFIFYYPTDWTISQDDPMTVRLYSSTTIAAASTGGSQETAADLTIATIPNPSALSINEFANGYQGGWLPLYNQAANATVGGRQALILNDLSSDIPRVLALATFVAANSTTVLLVTGHASTQQEYRSILASIQFP